MNIERTLDRLHETVTRNRLLQLFTVSTRVLLAVGFIPPSVKKIMGLPFTSLPASNPVGAYFIALLNTGFYYEFIGWAQLAAAVMLLFPRTAHLGSLMFLPIILNIAVLTSSVGFKGTWLVTILMSLAALYLVVWDYDRLKPIFFQSRGERTRAIPYQFVSIPAFFAAGGLVMGGIWAVIGLGNFSNYYKISAVLAGLGFGFGLLVALHYRFMQTGDLQKMGESV